MFDLKSSRGLWNRLGDLRDCAPKLLMKEAGQICKIEALSELNVISPTQRKQQCLALLE
jgi:hypothetical protein